MAARPTNVSSMWIRSERRVSMSSSLVPTQVRTSNTRVWALNSKIEPPSVSDRRTAWAMIVVSISSRSRLELTAWLISPRARSSSTERARSRPRCCELLEELHVLDRDRALRGEGVGERDRLVVERVDLVAPERDDAEDALVDQHRHAEQGADAAELARPVPLVVGVGEHVRDLDRAALQADAADDRPASCAIGRSSISARYASGPPSR